MTTLQNLIDRRGVTYTYLAKLARISTRGLLDIRHGRVRNVRPTTAKRLATALNVSVEELRAILSGGK